MDVRGRNIDVLSQFIRNLEGADTFQNAVVLSESRADLGGGSEILLSMTVEYMPEGGGGL